MIDIKLLREHPEQVRDMLSKRNIEFPLGDLIRLDGERRSLITKTQTLKTQRNKISIEIANSKKSGHNTDVHIAKMKEVSDEIAIADDRTNQLEQEIKVLMMKLPNLIDKSVPIAKDETLNIEIRKWGKTSFSFKVKDHIEIGEKLGLIDTERAAKISGARFYFLNKDLVRLNYAVISFALDFIAKRGHTLVQPPYMLNRESMSGAVILSDFEDVIYKVEGDDLYLIGTSEHAIAAMHAGMIFTSTDLPSRYAAISPCFRREAGAHGRDTKGIFRVHQFEKVEQFVFSKPEESWAEHERLLKNAEEFNQALEIPYRVVLLSSSDMGKVAAKTYDIEAWFPGQNKYREIVSCSNCTDYQARRFGIKFRYKPHEESILCHTLNSTLVATERTLIAIMENYQRPDGSLLIPKVLHKYMDGQEVIPSLNI
ncbi:MAG: serine--tRNA ligase [Thaumarchaeota archaeon]|nr:serine--tRNA ligase [Nitrososphaerota archaeon]